jgi:hypothetical protein
MYIARINREVISNGHFGLNMFLCLLWYQYITFIIIIKNEAIPDNQLIIARNEAILTFCLSTFPSFRLRNNMLRNEKNENKKIY